MHSSYTGTQAHRHTEPLSHISRRPLPVQAARARTCTAAGAAAAGAAEPGGGALARNEDSGCGREPAALLPASYRCTAPQRVAAANQEPAALKARLSTGES